MPDQPQTFVDQALITLGLLLTDRAGPGDLNPPVILVGPEAEAPHEIPAGDNCQLPRRPPGQVITHQLDGTPPTTIPARTGDDLISRCHRGGMDQTSSMDAHDAGRHDYAAGTVDESRTADRAYVAGLAAARSDSIDRELQAWSPDRSQ